MVEVSDVASPLRPERTGDPYATERLWRGVTAHRMGDDPPSSMMKSDETMFNPLRRR
ncbi:hypothetical protein ACIPX0_38925 [Streptomyces sp. NPDC090075]|uniref:hypothetical protein n=1 Tax=Streptomyces sp. NPDC090075 TaxID=3365937 RepID=UPI00382E292F